MITTIKYICGKCGYQFIRSIPQWARVLKFEEYMCQACDYVMHKEITREPSDANKDTTKPQQIGSLLDWRKEVEEDCYGGTAGE